MRAVARDGYCGANVPALMCIAKAPESMAFADNNSVDTTCPSTGMTKPSNWASIVAKNVVCVGVGAWSNQRVIDINWLGIDTTYNDADELQPRLPRLDEVMLSLLPLVVAGARLTGAIYWKAE